MDSKKRKYQRNITNLYINQQQATVVGWRKINIASILRKNNKFSEKALVLEEQYNITMEDIEGLDHKIDVITDMRRRYTA